MSVFTAEQVKSLNEFQGAGVFHPFACGNDNCRCDLFATEDGWKCPREGCGYTQDWAHGFMLSGEWKKYDPFRELRTQKEST